MISLVKQKKTGKPFKILLVLETEKNPIYDSVMCVCTCKQLIKSSIAAFELPLTVQAEI